MSTLTKITHTPGPWIVESWRSNYTGWISIQQEPGDATFPRNRRIATLPWRDEGPEVTGKALEESTAFNGVTLANARLIAAAPDLLAALRSILDGTSEFDLDPRLRALGQAALAKATGAR